MKKIVLLAFMAWATYLCNAQIGMPDPSFGNNGSIITNANGAGRGRNHFPQKCIVLPDGKLIFVINSNGKSMLAKRLADGSRDLSYADGGYSKIVSMSGSDAVLQPDGKIVVAGMGVGYFPVLFGNTPSVASDFIIARYNPDGTLDASFGSNGVTVTDLGSTADYVSSVLLTSAGDIIVAGSTQVNSIDQFALASYDQNGHLNNDFGNNGIALTVFDGRPARPCSLLLRADGSFIAAGTIGPYGTRDFAIAAYNPDGSPLSTFNSTGTVIAGFGAHDQALTAALGANGKIYVGGYTVLTIPEHLTVARFNADGSPDLTYNAGQAFIAPPLPGFPGSGHFPYTMIFQPDEKFLVGSANFDFEFLVARYNNNGTPDNSFNGGSTIVNVGRGSQNACFALQPDGKVIMGGESYSINIIGPQDANSFIFYRFQTNGLLDPTFNPSSGIPGILSDYRPYSTYYYTSLFSQEDGKILATSGSNIDTDSSTFVTRFNPNGTPDNSFGQNGVIQTDPNRPFDELGLFLPNGKLISIGYIQGDGEIKPQRPGNRISRFNPDTSPDNSFGVNGSVDIDFTITHLTQVALQTDGKIIVGGTREVNPNGTNWFIARLNDNGTVDGSFGTDGFIHLDWQVDDYLESIAIGHDGSIFVGGSSRTNAVASPESNTANTFDIIIAKFTPNGGSDLLFGQKLINQTFYDRLGKLTVQADGKLLYTSYHSFSLPHNWVLNRLNIDGNPDTDFGQVPVDGPYLVVQNDQKIIVAGNKLNTQNNRDFSVARFNTDGGADPSFGNGGKIIASFSMIDHNPTDIYLFGSNLFLIGYVFDDNGNKRGIITKFLLEASSGGNLTCPQNKIVLTDKGVCSAKVYKIDPVVSGTKNTAVTYTLTGATTGTGTGSASGKTFNKGITTVTYTLSSDPTQTCSFTVTVKDKELPVITGLYANPTTLWPPNHKMVEVTLTYQVSDNCGAPRVALGISSNEPVTSSDNGDQSPDWQIIDANRVKLRAERLNSGNGRVYTIRVFATDQSGNQTVQSVTVKVPKNQSPGQTDLKVNVAPNPTSSYFNVYVNSSSEERINLRVLNLKGVVLFTINNVSPQQNLKIGDKLGAGAYFLEATQGATKKTVKLIKN